MKLPPLGPAPSRKAPPVENTPLVDAGSAEEQALLAGGPDPGLAGAGPPAGNPSPYAAPPPPDPVLQRRLEAPVLIRGMGVMQAPEIRIRR